MAIKLKTALPKDEGANGLDYAASQEMVTNPRRQYVLVAYVSVAQIVQDVAEEETYDSPVLAIDAVECLGDALDCPPEVRAAFQARHARRTDRGILPGLGALADTTVVSINGNRVDPQTGEVLS